MLIKDLYFIKPEARLTITGDSSYSTATNYASNPSVAFGFLAGVSYTRTSLIDSNAFNPSAPFPNSDISLTSETSTSPFTQDRKNLFSNINVIESKIILTTSGTFTMQAPSIVQDLSNITLGGILGAGFINQRGVKTTFNSGSFTDDVDKNTNSIVASTSQVSVSTASGSSIPLASKIGGIAGTLSGRISGSSSRLSITSNSSSTQSSPTLSFGIGGLAGEFAVTPFTCSSLSGAETESITVNNDSNAATTKHYCGLVNNKVVLDIDLPTYSNIGGLFGAMRNLSWSGDANQAMNFYPYRLGIIKQNVSGSLKCATNCGGLWGMSLSRSAATIIALDDSSVPSLALDSNRLNINIEGLSNVSGLGALSTIVPNSLASGCLPSHRCDQGRVVIQKSSVEGEIKCLISAPENTCSTIGGLISTLTRRCSTVTGASEINQGTALEIYDNIVKPVLTIEKGTNSPTKVGGVFGEFVDQAPCGSPVVGTSGFNSKVSRLIANSDINIIDTTSDRSQIYTGYHWFSPAMTTTAGLTKMQNVIFYNDYDGRSIPPSILSSYSLTELVKLQNGKESDSYPNFNFTTIWSNDNDTVIPYLR
jgi:hypothetical protein